MLFSSSSSSNSSSSSSSTIQCKRERIREDGKYMHRERENAYENKERENMQQQLLFFSEISTSGHI